MASPDIDLRAGTMVGLFFVSLLAVSFPAISQRSHSIISIPKILFFIGKHFGTGVILSTAFCHLLQDSFESLQSPIVKEKHPRICNETGLIILVSLLTIFLVEYISTTYVDHLHAEPSAPSSPVSHTPLPDPELLVDTSEHTPLISRSNRPPHLVLSTPSREHYLTSIVTNSPRYSRSNENFYIINDLKHHLRNGEYHLTEQGKCLCVSVCADHGRGGTKPPPNSEHDAEKKAAVGRRRQVVGILVLQLGIMVHSLVIGLTLALTTGTEFTSLVTAIVFHQMFEGLSLGIRIAALPSSPAENNIQLLTPRPTSWLSSRLRLLRRYWLQPTLSFLFAVTTPFGMGLGMLVFTTNAGTNSQERMLLTQGLMSAVSAGMLIYAATVEMLAGDFVFGTLGGHGHSSQSGHGHSHGTEIIESLDGHSEHGDGEDAGLGRKTLAVCSLLGGVVTMGLVGLGE